CALIVSDYLFLLRLVLFFFSCYRPPRYLHSFPTRRSSDLRRWRLGLSSPPADGCRFPGVVGEAAARAHTIRSRHTAAMGVDESRSEEHTSELQSRFDLVCRLLLEKKKNKEHTSDYQANGGS